MAQPSNTPDPSIVYQVQHYNEDRGRSDLAACLVCIIAVVVVFPLRIYALALPTNIRSGLNRKDWSKALWRTDTIFLFLASFFAILCVIAIIIPFQYGFGKHQVRVLEEDPFAPRNIIVMAMCGYAMKIVQFPSVMFTKLAIISLYYRVFSVNKKLTYTLHAVAIYSILLGVGCMLLYIFPCHPVRFFWERLYFLLPGTIPDDVNENGYCVPTLPVILTPLFLEFVSEIALLLFPAIALRKARLSMRKKIGLYFVFTLGGFTTSISVIRLYYILTVKNINDITWDAGPAVIWTAVQTCFSVVCASLPSIAPLLRLFRERDDAQEIKSEKLSGGSISSGSSTI